MKKYLIILVTSILFSTLHAQDLSQKEINNWMTYYYKLPKPKMTSSIVEKFHELNYLAQPNALAPLSAFFSIIFTENPKLISNWIEHFKTYSLKEKKYFIML